MLTRFNWRWMRWTWSNDDRLPPSSPAHCLRPTEESVTTSRRVRHGLQLKLYLFNLLLRPRRGAEYCDQPVCLSVCRSVREHISGTAGPIGTFCVPIHCGGGSILFRRRCATLCTSGFVDDVTFGRNGQCDVAWPAWWTIRQLRARPERSLMSMIALLCIRSTFTGYYCLVIDAAAANVIGLWLI